MNKGGFFCVGCRFDVDGYCREWNASVKTLLKMGYLKEGESCKFREEKEKSE